MSKRKRKQTYANDDNEGFLSDATAGGEWCWGGRVPRRLAGRIGGLHSCPRVGNPVGPHGLSQTDKLRHLGGAGGRVRGLARRSVARGRLLGCCCRSVRASGRLLGSPRDAYRPGRCPARRALSRRHCPDVRHSGGHHGARCRPLLIPTDSVGVGVTRPRSAILTGYGGWHPRRISCQRRCHPWVRTAARLAGDRRRAERNDCGLAGAERADNRGNRDDSADPRLFRTDGCANQAVSCNRDVDDD